MHKLTTYRFSTLQKLANAPEPKEIYGDLGDIDNTFLTPGIKNVLVRISINSGQKHLP
jgi:hypothetical protein